MDNYYKVQDLIITYKETLMSNKCGNQMVIVLFADPVPNFDFIFNYNNDNNFYCRRKISKSIKLKTWIRLQAGDYYTYPSKT